MFGLLRLQSLLVLGFVTCVNVASAVQQSVGLPRKLLQTTTQYHGFFDKNRPSECGFTCRVIVIAVGGGIVLLLLLAALVCCCCCCCRRKQRTRTTVVNNEKPEPYNYQASPAIVPTNTAVNGVGSPPVLSTGPGPTGTTASYGGTTGTYGAVAPVTGYSVPVPAGRNTMPGTYNPRKF